MSWRRDYQPCLVGSQMEGTGLVDQIKVSAEVDKVGNRAVEAFLYPIPALQDDGPV